jgi:hypothetical protein
MEDICERHEKCPIYSGILQSKQFASEVYRTQYCRAGEEGRKKCKRYQVSLIAGSCPPDVLPNSSKSVDDIIASMQTTNQT